jgi:predicted helicase
LSKTQIFNDALTKNHYKFFGNDLSKDNYLVSFLGKDTTIPFSVISFKNIIDSNCISPASGGSQCLPLYRYDSNGNRHDNLTDWGLSQFTTHYKDNSITKEAVFNYTYGVLHNPAYRKKYELNLKREFPRLPFYKDFWQWSKSGKALMDLHLEYETVEPFALKRVDKAEPKKVEKPSLFGADSSGDSKSPDELKLFKAKGKLKVKLKADKETGIIYIDEYTHLEGIPDIAWTYKLGNRSALEWILDQYKEKKPRDKTIAEKFNTYQFADYKETVIDLLMRVCTVSVRTMEIINEMK